MPMTASARAVSRPPILAPAALVFAAAVISPIHWAKQKGRPIGRPSHRKYIDALTASGWPEPPDRWSHPDQQAPFHLPAACRMQRRPASGEEPEGQETYALVVSFIFRQTK